MDDDDGIVMIDVISEMNLRVLSLFIPWIEYALNF
jgi:hypothetical protein